LNHFWRPQNAEKVQRERLAKEDKERLRFMGELGEIRFDAQLVRSVLAVCFTDLS
jgi:hypothetical protein